MLERGRDLAQLMTTRLGSRAYDSFVPAPIGELAKWTTEEGDQRGLSRREGAHSPGGCLTMRAVRRSLVPPPK